MSHTFSNTVQDHLVKSSQPSPITDPLNSPHPVPWAWVMETYNNFLNYPNIKETRYYRTPSLLSPDGKYAAYSRISMEVDPQFCQCRVNSVMFLENLHSGELRLITASSPLADNPFNLNQDARQPGTIAILMPISWSVQGERILARQFEGIFNSSQMFDYAVIWDRNENKTRTIYPEESNQFDYTVLLGWSKKYADQVLFRGDILGEENPSILSVNFKGKTMISIQDQPVIYCQK
jgi:hypothetical protein